MMKQEEIQNSFDNNNLSDKALSEDKTLNSSDPRELFLEKLSFHCEVVAKLAFKRIESIDDFLKTHTKAETQISSKEVKHLKLFQNIPAKPILITEDILKSFTSLKKSLVKLQTEAAEIYDKLEQLKKQSSKAIVQQPSREFNPPYNVYFDTSTIYTLLSSHVERCIHLLKNIPLETTSFKNLQEECLKELETINEGIKSGNDFNFAELLKTIKSDFKKVCEQLQPPLQEQQKKSILEIDANCQNLIELLEKMFNNFPPNLLNSKFIEHKKMYFNLIPTNNLWQRYLDLYQKFSANLETMTDYFQSSDSEQSSFIDPAQRSLQNIKAEEELSTAIIQLFEEAEKKHCVPRRLLFKHDNGERLLKNWWLQILLQEHYGDNSQQTAEERAKLSQELLNLKDIDIIKAATIFNYRLPVSPLKKFYADKILTTTHSKALVDKNSPLELRFLIELIILCERANLIRASIHKTSYLDTTAFLKNFYNQLRELSEQAQQLQDSLLTYNNITNHWEESFLQSLITLTTDIQLKHINFFTQNSQLLPEENAEHDLVISNPKTDKKSSHHRRRSLSDYWAILFPKIQLKDKEVKEENSPAIQSKTSVSGKEEEEEESSSEQNRMLGRQRQRSMSS